MNKLSVRRQEGLVHRRPDQSHAFRLVRRLLACLEVAIASNVREQQRVDGVRGKVAHSPVEDRKKAAVVRVEPGSNAEPVLLVPPCANLLVRWATDARNNKGAEACTMS